ncbi:hypothetical protein L6452_01158 [Arctium lappa]|uniref:Uncharacterized protein n=1 Tax=Arctium lappa TaxID=4217 RepID=A0ACB9FGI3_ARCLA|nr:hypothetical protein L6452_01158 [Arctium lappa]
MVVVSSASARGAQKIDQIRYRVVDNSEIMEIRGEIGGETPPGEVEDKIYVAVGKDLKMLVSDSPENLYRVGLIVSQDLNLENHTPLPGIKVGDIGLKFGNGAYNTIDIGVLRFDHVRISRNQMLMRVSQVTKEGNFVQFDVPRQLIYGTMVYVRQKIVVDASKALSRAVLLLQDIVQCGHNLSHVMVDRRVPE